MSDIDDLEHWRYDHDEPDEPGCWDCWNAWSGSCWSCGPPTARIRRRLARHWGQQRRQWRKIARHANDRFWRARNRPAFDERPF